MWSVKNKKCFCWTRQSLSIYKGALYMKYNESKIKEINNIVLPIKVHLKFKNIIIIKTQPQNGKTKRNHYPWAGS